MNVCAFASNSISVIFDEMTVMMVAPLHKHRPKIDLQIENLSAEKNFLVE